MSFSFPSFAETGTNIFGHNGVNDKSEVTGGYAADGTINVSDGKLPGFMIRWQDGPLDRKNNDRPNGAFVEDILEVCRIRLSKYQNSPFGCPENDEAMRGIQSAITWLTKRREDRKKRGVLGKNEV